MTELMKNELTKLTTKDYLDAISRTDHEYRELMKLLDGKLIEQYPELKDRFSYVQVAVTRDYNYGTADRTSEINLQVVYSEWGSGNFTIRRSKRVNFSTELTVDYKKDENDVALPVKLKVDFLHIADYLKLLSKSDYQALEILTSRYQIYSSISNSKIDLILNFYNFDKLKDNVADALIGVEKKLLGNILTDTEEEKCKQRLGKHLIMLNVLSKQANIKLLHCGDFWDMTNTADITPDQARLYLKTKNVLGKPSEEYLDLLDSMYYEIAK